MLLSSGHRGKRFMLEHASAMLHQPRVPPTGQRQAVEIAIKWKEVLAQKENLLNILSYTTGHSMEKLDKVGGGMGCGVWAARDGGGGRQGGWEGKGGAGRAVFPRGAAGGLG